MAHGRSRFQSRACQSSCGRATKALADLGQPKALNPKHAYAAIWLDIVDKRSNLPRRLAGAAAGAQRMSNSTEPGKAGR